VPSLADKSPHPSVPNIETLAPINWDVFGAFVPQISKQLIF